MPRRVLKTRAGGKWTEARYWTFVRSALRQASRKWPPRLEALKKSRFPYRGANKRRKWSHRCAICDKTFKGTDVQVDHINACGKLNRVEDLPGFVDRLFCEVDGFRVLCKPCHKTITKGAKNE